MTTKDLIAYGIRTGQITPAKPSHVTERTIRRVKAETARIERGGVKKKVRLIVGPR